ncbi:MAG: enoyl-CoA hydratase/isomerase family protein [Sphingorhabdus sp.]
MTDLDITLDGHVGILTIMRPPHNYFDADLICAIADALENFDRDEKCRAVVLCSEGKSFCVGGDFGEEGEKADLEMIRYLYSNGSRLFQRKKPMIAAIQGAAIGGGLGLALTADMRVACEDAYFMANFTKLGIHPGFGSSYTLPRLVGPSRAALIFYSSRRIGGQQASDWGLADKLVPLEEVRAASIEFAREIGLCAPLAVQDIHATLMKGVADNVAQAIDHELSRQTENFETKDFKEGVRSFKERRPAEFVGS